LSGYILFGLLRIHCPLSRLFGLLVPDPVLGLVLLLGLVVPDPVLKLVPLPVAPEVPEFVLLGLP
jgi:putative effector of murein hydrolase LrgA (UPF0299 family)